MQRQRRRSVAAAKQGNHARWGGEEIAGTGARRGNQRVRVRAIRQRSGIGARSCAALAGDDSIRKGARPARRAMSHARYE